MNFFKQYSARWADTYKHKQTQLPCPFSQNIDVYARQTDRCTHACSFSKDDAFPFSSIISLIKIYVAGPQPGMELGGPGPPFGGKSPAR